jgi:hypothetical protein
LPKRVFIGPPPISVFLSMVLSSFIFVGWGNS